jgi:hypothetical protein
MAMSCARSNNLGAESHCKCSFTDCDKWGKCCSCVLFHRTRGGLPGCFFTEEAEKTGNRDVDYFIKNIGVPMKESH